MSDVHSPSSPPEPGHCSAAENTEHAVGVGGLEVWDAEKTQCTVQGLGESMLSVSPRRRRGG